MAPASEVNTLVDRLEGAISAALAPLSGDKVLSLLTCAVDQLDLCALVAEEDHRLRPPAQVKIVESTHDYANNIDSVTAVHLPGVTSMTVVFDPRSKTESGDRLESDVFLALRVSFCFLAAFSCLSRCPEAPTR
jgi:hypothetical protein